MNDNLKALSVEKLNLSMRGAVNAAIIPRDRDLKPNLRNILPGAITIPTSLPSSAPLMYSFNVNTPTPVLAVSNKQPIQTAVPIAGTIIPVRRQAPLVQLTPISSCPNVQPVQANTLTPSAPQSLPMLLPKQNVPVPTVQLVGPAPAPRLTSIPIVTNLPSQQPQHAGTLILPSGQSINVQSVKTDNYIPTNSSASVQLVPMLPNTTQVQCIAPSVDQSSVNTLCTAESVGNLQQNSVMCSQQKTYHSNREPVESKIILNQENTICGNIGGGNLNRSLQFSRDTSQFAAYIDVQKTDGTFNVNDVKTVKSSAFSPNIVNQVKNGGEMGTDKENNLIASAFALVNSASEAQTMSFDIRGPEHQVQMKMNNHQSPPPTLVLAIDQRTNESNSNKIFCVSCGTALEGQCTVHTDPVVQVSDSVILSYARASLPGILELKTSLLNRTETGLFSRGSLARNTRFGPLIGESYTIEEFKKSQSSSLQFWPIFNNEGHCLHMIQNGNEESANWMKFVQQAKSSQQQNVVAFQQGGDIYFVTNKTVEPNTELLYWYSKDMATFMGLCETPEESFKCRQCEKQFTDDKLLRQHVKFKHPDTSTRKFGCQVCKKAFPSSSKLNTHMRGHAGIRPHKCNICHKTFVDRSNLKMHMSIHTGERKFNCTMCNKTFRQKAHLDSHTLTHTRAKTARCQFCQKTFARQSDLRRHERLHTKETVFVCDLCKKEFYTKQNLAKHKKIHTGKKDFACDRCKKTFFTNYHLKRHLSTCNAKPAEPVTRS